MTVTHIYLYPVKSLSGISVEEAHLTSRGFQHDRRWMLVDQDGVFISQRTHPQLALVNVEITQHTLHLFTNAKPEGVHVPLKPRNDQELISVKVWNAECLAVSGFESANVWLNRELSMNCQLVYMPAQTKRLIDSDLVPADAIVSFADGYPYLVVGSASLDDLNQKLETPVGIERFRPNIVVATKTAFEEDQWKDFQLGSVLFTGVKPCSRCSMVNVDQQTALSSGEPLRTLASYRKKGNKVLFGLNAIWRAGNRLKVGDKMISVNTSSS